MLIALPMKCHFYEMFGLRNVNCPQIFFSMKYPIYERFMYDLSKHYYFTCFIYNYYSLALNQK